MTFAEAKTKALAFYEEMGITGLASALDAEDSWIFYGGKKGETIYGMPGARVFKESGEVVEFILPDKDNFDVLDRAAEIELD